jgi:hypothetical protein
MAKGMNKRKDEKKPKKEKAKVPLVSTVASKGTVQINTIKGKS